MIRMFSSPQFRSLAIAVAATLGCKAIFELTPAGAWLDATPAAIAAIRVLGVLFFGAIGFVLLLGDEHWGYRLIGIFCLVLASVHLALLVTGANDPADLLTHSAAPSGLAEFA